MWEEVEIPPCNMNSALEKQREYLRFVTVCAGTTWCLFVGEGFETCLKTQCTVTLESVPVLNLPKQGQKTLLPSERYL